MIAVFLLLSYSAGAIEVIGHGQTFEQAKENAFRQAIELEVGALVLSEREIRDYRFIKNNILVYSAGYVTSYDVISQKVENGQVNVTMNVTVATTELKNQILSQSEVPFKLSKEVPVQIKTYKHSKAQGDKLLERVMQKYPQAAYNISDISTLVMIDSSRTAQLQISFTVTWNQEYLAELSETLRILQDSHSDSYYGKIIIREKNNSHWFFRSEHRYYFADKFPLEIMDTNIGDKDIRIRVNLKNDNEITGYMCSKPSSMLQIDQQTLLINGNGSENYVVNISESYLADVTDIELLVDDVTTCRN